MAARKKAGPEQQLSFEEALSQLENVVRTLETGELNLEEALQQFEHGIGLVRTCNERLNTAESRIKALVANEDGSLVLEQFKWENKNGGKN